jgi:iron complex outermembrane receptor protein
MSIQCHRAGRRPLLLTQILLVTTALATPALAQIETVVVTAEKRVQNLQTVPIAVSAFSSEKRDLVGINSIQDMTNFTPGLQYNGSRDRISLRGVGRLTNVLSADASVANYDDGLYETFAVAAGRSSLELERVEVLRGPQGTLYGRNAIAGALNEITRRPTDEFEGEARLTYGAYNHTTAEVNVSGPIDDRWQYRVFGSYEKQTEGWTKNIIPGAPSEGNVIDEWYIDAQIQAKFGQRLEMWTKVQSTQWWNGAGGPGSESSGWNPYDGPTYEFGANATALNLGYGCSAPGFTYDAAAAGGATTAASATSPLSASGACLNPEVNDPRKIARLTPYTVKVPYYLSVNSQWTWHADNFDIKYIGGGSYYHYILTGGDPTGEGGDGAPIGRPPISSVTINSFVGPSLVLGGPETFNYQEKNGFISNELNFLSTTESRLQWVAGVYEFQQHYSQPVFTSQPGQDQWNGVNPPFGAPGFFCALTGGVCAPAFGERRFDNRPSLNDTSLAAYIQSDYKVTDTVKLTGGVRYSYDRKYGHESVRLLCFGVPACFTAPEFNPFIPGGLPAVDLTQLPTVVDPGTPPPKGVDGPTIYGADGFATRKYDASWDAVTGTAGVDWTPSEDTLAYGKYSRGYRSGGFNVGIFTVLAPSPWTNKESVDSFEVGLKKSVGDWLTANMALYHYGYTNLQIPLTIVNSAGGFQPNASTFYNVPKAVSQGFELETTIVPVENLAVLFNYSFDDAHIDKGTAPDAADPNAIAPGAKPLYTPAQCAANPGVCTVDIYTLSGGGNGWNIPQSLEGNRLPNAARNKVAVNVSYAWHASLGIFSPSVSYIWRDAQYGTLFTRDYNRAPSWDQWDARVQFQPSADSPLEVIAFGKNIFNKIGYDAGAIGHRLAGTVNDLGGNPTNFVQGLNGPPGFGAVRGEDSAGHVKTYYITPPATWGLEVHYKF